MHGARRRLAVDLADARRRRRRRGIDAFRAEVRALLQEIARAAGQGTAQPARGGGLRHARAGPRRGAATPRRSSCSSSRRSSAPPRCTKPNIGVGGWALPNLIVHGTEAQRERWIMPTLRGEIGWCQLFSEPGAGSDLASLSTKATRVEGGWLLNGQKVWTSMAKEADWGICLARTNPEAAKHDGISCFMVDMQTPGIDIRPLRELTGMAMFNEVFFDDVFVPEDCLVGREHDGWRAARTTLANERVYMGSGNTIGGGVVGVLKAIEARGRADDRLALGRGGRPRRHRPRPVGPRVPADPRRAGRRRPVGFGGRRPQAARRPARPARPGGRAWSSPGIEATAAEGDAAAWSASFLFNRCLTIAGGTSDIQRNVIAERLLGLPRDP